MAEEIILPPNSKAIPLTQGKFAIVDGDDYEWLMQWRWCYSTGYAVNVKYIATINGTPKNLITSMHRLIMNSPIGMHTDHKNRNKLDNRRCNLRICTASENGMNKRSKIGTFSKYKGVGWHKEGKKWQAYIRIGGKFKYLGLFTSESEAALVYNKAAEENFGEFAFLNQIEIS